jgi:hypothetical protein
VQVFFPAVELHVNAVAAPIVSKAGVERLVNVAN